MANLPFFPRLRNSLLKRIGVLSSEKATGYFAGYASFEEAAQDCSGYDADNILEKTKKALLKVKNGEAMYERDSVLFQEVQYSWPLLASLMYAAAKHDGRLSIIDFGGSLGSTYFQNRKFLRGLDVNWCVVEQERHVACGKEFFQNNSLKFYFSIEECLKNEDIYAILLLSSLQYIPKPFDLLEQISTHECFDFIIFDRTPILNIGKNFFVKQVVPESVYSASYPVTLFDEGMLLGHLKQIYQPIEDWAEWGGFEINNNDVKGIYKGYLFNRKKHFTKIAER